MEAARAGEQFEDGDETLGVYLLAGDGEQVRRFLSLAQAAYLQETTSWPEIVFNQGKNLRCVGSVTSEGVVEIGFRGTIVHGSDGERNLDNWIRVNARVAPVPLNADFGLSVTSAGHDAGIATAVRVHSGFQQAYSLLRPAVLAWLSANGSLDYHGENINGAYDLMLTPDNRTSLLWEDGGDRFIIISPQVDTTLNAETVIVACHAAQSA